MKPVRRHIALIAAVAALLHALLPFVARAGDGVLVPVCTSFGVQLVALDGDSAPEDGSIKAARMSCPLCASGVHFVLADGTAGFADPNAALAVHERAAGECTLAADQPQQRYFSSRAPPRI